MCTITFSPGTKRYYLVMNRDEKRARAAAFGPKVHRAEGRAALFPFETGGGTWIAVNDAGVSFALVNWYAVAARVRATPVSRGVIVKTLAYCRTDQEADKALHAQPLSRINPFRLVGVFGPAGAVREWRWDLTRLDCLELDWSPRQWISSGYDEPGAQRTRSQVWRESLAQGRPGTLAWCRRLHASHRPERGPYSTCMHREDAATVSYTEICVAPLAMTLRYRPGPPCLKRPMMVRRVSYASGALP